MSYPKEVKEKKIQGRVVVRFVIEKDGSISNANILKGVEKSLDAEVIRLINSMPKWTPGKQSGKTVKCYFTLPISFKLEE